LDIIITGEQTTWIKYGSWFHKKMQKKRKTLVKIEGFKVQHWLYSAG